MPDRRRRHKLFWMVLFTFLAACGNQATVLPMQTSAPTAVLPTHVSTPTFVSFNFTPSPFPTEPVFPVITPDPVQVERWHEYEDALARTFFFSHARPEDVVCEWGILGRADREVYVWTHCALVYSAGPSEVSVPAVIHLGADGSVQDAEVPGAGSSYGADIRKMFPPDLQERIFNHEVNFQGWGDRLRWRRAHPDAPPLIVLPFLPAGPTQTAFAVITPDHAQVERWREYQTALAENLSYLPPEQILCEWEFLGRVGNEVYVWAICGPIWGDGGLEDIVRIDVGDDGSVQQALLHGLNIVQMLPPDAQEKYFSGLIRFQELVDHLRWRQQHPEAEEPPLIVLNGTLTP